MWVQWDDSAGRMLGVVRQLPASLHGRDAAQLIQLGYRELITEQPEDFIPRFSDLLGQAKFELMPDGRVLQTYPDADFSVHRVRDSLVRAMKRAAMQELGATDWYFIRALEYSDTPVPSEVKALRRAIRDHTEWIEADIAKASPRKLVDYQWMFPRSADQKMVRGVPVRFEDTPPPPVTSLPEPPDPVLAVTGEAQGVFGNDDPELVDDAPEPPPAPAVQAPPATTDGPVPVWNEEDGRPDFLDANGIPLITAYAPNVDDPGPQPDHN